MKVDKKWISKDTSRQQPFLLYTICLWSYLVILIVMIFHRWRTSSVLSVQWRKCNTKFPMLCSIWIQKIKQSSKCQFLTLSFGHYSIHIDIIINQQYKDKLGGFQFTNMTCPDAISLYIGQYISNALSKRKRIISDRSNLC